MRVRCLYDNDTPGRLPRHASHGRASKPFGATCGGNGSAAPPGGMRGAPESVSNSIGVRGDRQLGRAALGRPLAGLLEAAATGDRPLTVAFPEPLPPHAQRLMDTLGVVTRIDPHAPVLSTVRTNGHAGRTRRELTAETKTRMRASYFARPDKERYRPN